MTINVGDTVRYVKYTKALAKGQEGEVLSVYRYPNKQGGVDVNYKVRFAAGPICVVGQADIEGALGLGALA